MQTFLIESDHAGDAQKIKEILENRFPYNVDISFSVRETALVLRSKPVRMMVVSMKMWTEEFVNRLVDIRKCNPQMSIVLVLDKVDMLNPDIAQRNRMYVLPRPLDEKNLAGVIRKMLLLRQIPQQRHTRFSTDTTSIIEFPLTGDELNTKLFNLSQSGAYVEFENKPPVSVGDMVRVKVSLNELNKDHHIPAKVVWFSRRGPANGGFGVGLQFVQEAEYYHQMLARI